MDRKHKKREKASWVERTLATKTIYEKAEDKEKKMMIREIRKIWTLYIFLLFLLSHYLCDIEPTIYTLFV